MDKDGKKISSVNYYEVFSLIYKRDKDLIDEEVQTLIQSMKTKKLRKIKFHRRVNPCSNSEIISNTSHGNILPLKNLIKREHKHTASLGQASYNLGNKMKVVFGSNEMNSTKGLKDILKIKLYNNNILNRKYKAKRRYISFNNPLRPVNRLKKKFALLERTFIHDEDNQNMEEKVRRELDIEEYRQKRFQRTSKLLDEINTTDPSTIEKIYRYKLDSAMSLQEDCNRIKRKLYKMLGDSNRLVAKIEKHKRLKPYAPSLNK